MSFGQLTVWQRWIRLFRRFREKKTFLEKVLQLTTAFFEKNKTFLLLCFFLQGKRKIPLKWFPISAKAQTICKQVNDQSSRSSLKSGWVLFDKFFWTILLETWQNWPQWLITNFPLFNTALSAISKQRSSILTRFQAKVTQDLKNRQQH